MKTLAAGPFIGEFGYELFDWQGYLRAIAPQFDHIIVSSRPGHEALYSDFYHAFRPYWAATPACIGRKNFKEALPDAVAKDVFADLKDPRIVKLSGTSVFKDIKPQYVKYGTLIPELRYDVVLHARMLRIEPKTKLGLSPYMKSLKEARNWPADHWTELVRLLPHLRICSIGAVDGALHIPGTENLLGVSLSKLVNVLASSQLIVGPSSGAMHLATLCGCPQVVWFAQDQAAGPARLLARYTKDWNPFNTYVETIPNSWNPPADRVAEAIRHTCKFLAISKGQTTSNCGSAPG